MFDKHGMFVRWYREGRRNYGLNASEAIAYARDRRFLWGSDTPLWGVEVDPEGGLFVIVYDEDSSHEPEILDVCGGVDVDFDLSDHGNILTDFHQPYLVATAAGLARELMAS